MIKQINCSIWFVWSAWHGPHHRSTRSTWSAWSRWLLLLFRSTWSTTLGSVAHSRFDVVCFVVSLLFCSRLPLFVLPLPFSLSPFVAFFSFCFRFSLSVRCRSGWLPQSPHHRTTQHNIRTTSEQHNNTTTRLCSGWYYGIYKTSMLLNLSLLCWLLAPLSRPWPPTR